jgi:hypothetical protein
LTRPTLSQALREGNSSEVLLVKIEHPDGDVYLWDGLGVLDYDGHEWQGVSRLGAVQIAPSDTEVQVTDITFTLSGIDEEFVSYLDQTVKGLTAYVWKAFLGPDYRVRFTELLAECALDQPTFLPEPNTHPPIHQITPPQSPPTAGSTSSKTSRMRTGAPRISATT